MVGRNNENVFIVKIMVNSIRHSYSVDCDLLGFEMFLQLNLMVLNISRLRYCQLWNAIEMDQLIDYFNSK